MSLTSLQEICRDIAANGKTPTTALLKAKSPAGTSLTMIIKAIQQFKATQSNTGPSSLQKMDHSQSPTNKTEPNKQHDELVLVLNEQANQLFLQKRRIEQLEAANQNLQKDITDLQAQVKALCSR